MPKTMIPSKGQQKSIGGKGNGGWKKGNLLGIKGLNKREKPKQLTYCCIIFLEYDFSRDGVENICDVHL